MRQPHAPSQRVLSPASRFENMEEMGAARETAEARLAELEAELRRLRAR